MSENNRCERIAHLLLIENEVKKIEYSCVGVSIIDSVLDYIGFIEFSNGSDLSPIEKIMFSILERIKGDIKISYEGSYKFFFTPQAKIDKYRVDFLVGYLDDNINERVVIECDGYDFHEKTKEQVAYDKKRERFLTSKGYKILRYSGSEIYNNFDEIEKELLKLLDVGMPQSLFSIRRD